MLKNRKTKIKPAAFSFILLLVPLLFFACGEMLPTVENGNLEYPNDDNPDVVADGDTTPLPDGDDPIVADGDDDTMEIEEEEEVWLCPETGAFCGDDGTSILQCEPGSEDIELATLLKDCTPMPCIEPSETAPYCEVDYAISTSANKLKYQTWDSSRIAGTPSDSLNITSPPITVEAWVSGAPGYIFQKVEKQTQRINYSLAMVRNTEDQFELGIGFTSSDLATSLWFSIALQSAEGWVHLAAVTTPAESRLYYNGTRVELKSGQDITPPAQFYTEPTEVWMGLNGDGAIDELRISKDARYEGETISPERYFQSDESTVALWHFNEGTGGTINDASGNGNTLSINPDFFAPDGATPDISWVEGEFFSLSEE